MRKGFGVSCIILGICCLAVSVGLVIYNQQAAEYAQDASTDLLEALHEKIHTEESEDLPAEMLTTQVEGYDCIGYLSVPVLELELPVLAEWSYEKLKIAPCHYFGSCFEKDFVIAAHNYPSHFGRLSSLQPKDLILFTDISGKVYCYEVILLETLPSSATEAMIASGFDLSLYTCTPGGSNRVTVRCRKVNA